MDPIFLWLIGGILTLEGHFHFGSLVQYPDESGYPAVPFKEPLPAYSPSTQLSSGSGQYYFRFERNNAMNAM
jgi:hypothetical protein